MIKKLNEEKSKVNLILWISILFEIIVIGIGIFLLVNQIYVIGISFLIIFNIPYICLMVLVSKRHKKIEKAYIAYIGKILSNADFIEKFESVKEVDTKEYKKLGIIPNYTGLKLKNNLSGTYENVEYDMYDAFATVTSGNSTSVVFSGRIYELGLKNSHLHTIFTDNKYNRVKKMVKLPLEKNKIIKYVDGEIKDTITDLQVYQFFKSIKRNEKSKITIKITRNKVMVSISRMDELFKYTYLKPLKDLNFLDLETKISNELTNIIDNVKELLDDYLEE
ncbi:hypothetical protein BN85403050 [Alteracholeplasma palmae J233]|uniref:DUF3137 domain-containing protein n=1 Tax=Alteracholeplasma palmae (strain ATCC 49389 / J233) TaxID=1318466 RepID=U4KK40_ALTPJ|nr:hypothetical protein [Alteracholeplasma palmae]CCV63882.1 hypothetical protein BN85403050 [Alteracholeplasma palmae J233]